MAVKIIEIKKESCPAARLLGKNIEKFLIGVNGGRITGLKHWKQKSVFLLMGMLTSAQCI